MTRTMFRYATTAVSGLTLLGVICVVVTYFVRRDEPTVSAAQTPSRAVASSQTGREKPPATKAVSSASILTAAEAVRRSTSQPAHVEPYEQTEILAKASGFVSRVHVDLGDRVQKDQVLAELWIPEMDQERLVRIAAVDEAAAVVQQMQAAIVAAQALADAASAKQREAQASVSQYEADVDFRRSEHDRFVRLVGDKAINQALLDEKRKRLRSAESAVLAATAAVASAEASVQVEHARLEQAAANLAHAESQLKVIQADLKKTEVLMKYAQVRAPFAGIITRRRIDTGAFVASAASNQSESLFTLSMVDRLRIVVDLPESESALIHVGQPAELKVDALKGTSFSAVVKRSTGVLDPRTRTLRVEAELNAPAPQLRPGMFGLLTITLTAPPK